MKYILTRHTTTDWEATGRIKGQTDVRLNTQGKTNAARLAKSLSGLGIDFIVSSDLQRAVETAEIISAFLAVPVQHDARLRECSFGKVEGLTKRQAAEFYGPAIQQHWEDQHAQYDFRPFGGERRDEVYARHNKVLESLANEKPGNTVLLVGHGRGLNTLLAGQGHQPDLRQGEYRIIEYNPRAL